MVQAFARRLSAENRPGAVVIISSTNGFQAEEGSTAYDLSKGALVMMVRTLAMALAPHRIRVNGIAPGLIRTPLTKTWTEKSPNSSGITKRKSCWAASARPRIWAVRACFSAAKPCVTLPAKPWWWMAG